MMTMVVAVVTNVVVSGTVVVVDAEVVVVGATVVVVQAQPRTVPRSTDAVWTSVCLSGHETNTRKVNVPVVAAGATDVAGVESLAATDELYPVTAYVVASIDATARSIVIGISVWSFRIVQSTSR